MFRSGVAEDRLGRGRWVDRAGRLAQAFADALRVSYVKAGAPTYAELIHQGKAQRPPVALSDASLSDWLNGKSAPSKPEAVLFLVSYLQPKATQRTTYELKSAYWWEQLRLAAVRERNAGRGGRRGRPSPEAPTLTGGRGQALMGLVSGRPGGSKNRPARLGLPYVRWLEGLQYRA